jgi:hypothetical protein
METVKFSISASHVRSPGTGTAIVSIIIPLNVTNGLAAANGLCSRVARFFLVKYTNTGENAPNCYKIRQMSIKYIKWP